MPERQAAGLPARSTGRRHLRTVTVAAAGLLLLFAGAWGPPLIVWNASPSSPRGLYALMPGTPRVGDTVLVREDAALARMAARRGYLPRGRPLVKTLAARSGDRACAAGDDLRINGRLVAARRKADGAGRPLPRWSGCRRLVAGEVLLLGLGDPKSFDGRYHGPSAASDVLGPARLLWGV